MALTKARTYSSLMVFILRQSTRRGVRGVDIVGVSIVLFGTAVVLHPAVGFLVMSLLSLFLSS